jgi:hypothetical protein
MQIHQLFKLIDEEWSPARGNELVPELLLVGRVPWRRSESLSIRQALWKIRKGACGTPNLRQFLPPMSAKHTLQKIGLTGVNFVH